MKNKHLFLSQFVLRSLFVAGAMMCAEAQLPIFGQTPQSAQEQTTVNGAVYDGTGDPIIGASVIVEGTTRGTITDVDGKFSISCSPNDQLLITFIGYESEKLPATADLSHIVLFDEISQLEELIVIGYGTTTRKSAVGAVDQVRKEMIENRPVANATQALQGAAPNVIIQRRSNDPNAQTNNFNIRGISTTTDNSPLYVIDGLVSDATAFNQLNPSDIENISILKDAGTAAIYGSRAANGVVLVTTKSGQKYQDAQVKVTGQVGWNKIDYLFEAVPGYQNAIYTNMQYTSVGQDPIFSQEQIDDFYAHRDEEDWAYKQIYKTAMQQNYNVSVSGGNDKTTYMLSAGYFDQGSNYNVKNTHLGVTRYNLRSNITTEIKERFKLTTILDYSRHNSKSTDTGNIDVDAGRVPAWYTEKMVADDGRYLLTPTLGEGNPIGELNKGAYNKYRNDYLTINLNGELKIIEGLKLRGVFGANIATETRETQRHPQTYYQNESATEPVKVNESGNNADNWTKHFTRFNTQLLLDYNKTFAGEHNVNALVGFTNESYSDRSDAIKEVYIDDIAKPTARTTGEVGNISGTTTLESNSASSINSVIGRFGYNFNERYYGEFTFRYDGSSKFDKDYRWGFFPSVSLGWRPSEENFMNWYREHVGDLKIRASWGKLGNQSVGNYDRFTKYNVYANGYVFNNQVVSSAGFNLGKKDLSWETTTTINLGIDATFLDGALTLTADIFKQRTEDILQKPQVPTVFGTEFPLDNIGEMENKGWEVALGYRFTTGDFKHNVTFNIADTRNKVTKYPGHKLVRFNSDGDSGTLICEGEPYNVYYGWETDGLFQSWDEIANSALPDGAKSAAETGDMSDIAPGDWKFKDQNGDNIINDKDYVKLGDPFPHYTYGFNYNLTWKGVDFGMFWQGVGERTMFLRGEMIEPFHAGYSLTIYKHQLDFWTPTNTDARYPRLAVQGSNADKNNWGRPADYFLLNAAYLRLKNVVLGYTLPKQLTERVGINRLRIYANAQDLFTFSHNDFIDPESSDRDINNNVNGGSASGRQYQPTKYFGFGFELDF